MSDFLIIPNDENFHSQSLANVEHVRAPLFFVFTLHADVAVPVRRAWEPSRPCASWIQTFPWLRALPSPPAPLRCVCVCVSFHVHLCAPCRPWARAQVQGAKHRVDELFAQWLSLPHTGALVDRLIDDATHGRPLHMPTL